MKCSTIDKIAHQYGFASSQEMEEEFERYPKKLLLFNSSGIMNEMIAIALATVRITRQGYYGKGDTRIFLKNGIHENFDQAIPYSPQFLETMRIKGDTNKRRVPCRIRIIESDSLEAAVGLDKPLVLNFADPYVPGGGFLSGAKTQEESLCRASTLYSSLCSEKASEMYEYNKSYVSPVDSDFMLLSPEVCVFRNAEGNLLDIPRYLSVISAAAPDRYGRASQVPPAELRCVIKKRLQNVFMVALQNGYRSLVFGAWGCGAFGNDTAQVAECFYELLIREEYACYFDEIVFAILHSCTKLDIFNSVFGK